MVPRLGGRGASGVVGVCAVMSTAKMIKHVIINIFLTFIFYVFNDLILMINDKKTICFFMFDESFVIHDF